MNATGKEGRMSGKTKKYYAVAVGRHPGIYKEWFGENGAEIQVRGFPNARFKGFATQTEAEAFVKEHSRTEATAPSKGTAGKRAPSPKTPSKGRPIRMYTDGGCLNNPGPGGYGVVIINGKKRKELSGGFRWTTNNRMELTACIEGLSALKTPSRVMLHSDSKYVVNGITKGWAKRWRSKNWMRTETDPAVNPDLWGKLLDLCDYHTVEFVWVKGHAGNPENERCDRLSRKASSKTDLPVDEGYEGRYNTALGEAD